MVTGGMGDLRFGIRVLLKHPIPSLAMIITLALAVGANTALFSIAHQVLLAPLPFAGEDRLFFLLQGPGRGSVSPRNYVDWKENSRLFEIAAFDSFSLTLTGKSSPRRLEALRTASGFLSVLGIALERGRFFTESEDSPGAEPVAVVSSRLWHSAISVHSGGLGSTILLDGIPTTVIGVLPEDFEFLGETRQSRYDVIVPLALTEKQLDESQRGAQWIATVGRLKPEATVSQAGQEFSSIIEQLRKRTRRIPDDFEVTILPVRELMVGRVETVLYALLGAAGLVLLVALLNVAGLMLARATARKGEFALRGALGASGGRLSRQALIEGLLIAFLAGGTGLLLAFLTRDLLVALAPVDVPRLSDAGLNSAVLLFCLLLTTGAGILFGLTPACSALRVNLRTALADLQRSSTGSSRTRRFGTALVVSEVALAVILLSSAGLLLRSLHHLELVDPGFSIENVLRFRLSLPSSVYDTTEGVDRFYSDLRERLGLLPGVAGAAGIMHMPLAGEGNVSSTFSIEDAEEGVGDRLSNLRPVTPGYFSAMGIPVLAGREFREGEDDLAPGVMIVNQTFADRFFPDQEALGRRVRPHVGLARRGRWATIVGVVGDVHHRALNLAPDPEIYIPHSQSPVGDMTLVVKGRVPAESLAGPVRRLVAELDSTLPVMDLSTLEEVRSSSLASSRFQALLFGIFAVLSLFLATIGIFGLVSYQVLEQIPEIGVRRALGARNGQIVFLVLRRGIILAAMGLTAGLLGALWIGGLIRSLLYQVGPTDPLTLATPTLLILLAAVLATLPPALRAVRIAPLIAMRPR